MADGSAKRRTMPAQKPGESKQDYGTDPLLLAAVRRRFGRLAWDLAAHASNAVCDLWIGEHQNSLVQEWHRLDGLLWLNPPFSRIDPWAKKCAIEAAKGARILLLTPAAVGSEWFREHVAPNAYTLALNPRLTFVGETDPYIKDCQLSYFHAGLRGFDVWRWK
jgi:phage N-6-adenine-methyltransferase